MSFEEIQNGRKNQNQVKMFNKLDEHIIDVVNSSEFFANDRQDGGQTND